MTRGLDCSDGAASPGRDGAVTGRHRVTHRGRVGDGTNQRPEGRHIMTPAPPAAPTAGPALANAVWNHAQPGGTGRNQAEPDRAGTARENSYTDSVELAR